MLKCIFNSMLKCIFNSMLNSFIYIAYLCSDILTGRLVGGGGGGYLRLPMRQSMSVSDRMQNDDNNCCTP